MAWLFQDGRSRKKTHLHTDSLSPMCTLTHMSICTRRGHRKRDISVPQDRTLRILKASNSTLSVLSSALLFHIGTWNTWLLNHCLNDLSPLCCLYHGKMTWAAWESARGVAHTEWSGILRVRERRQKQVSLWTHDCLQLDYHPINTHIREKWKHRTCTE